MKSFVYTVFCVGTGVIGHQVHGSVFWSIMDFLFSPFAWLKWLLLHQVTLSIIKEAFAFFFR